MSLRYILKTSILMASTASAVRTLFVGSAKGTIKTYEFDEKANAQGLKEIASTPESTPASTWQTIFGNLLYSVSNTEASNEGAITAYQIGADKMLVKTGSAKGLAGPVSIAVGKGGKLVVAAAYNGGGIDSFSADGNGTLKHSQQFTYKLDKSGPVADRQENSHPHQAILDPTGEWVVVPDLGADLIRVYRANSNSTIDELPAIKTPGGFGPRHAVFYSATHKLEATHLLVVGELANKIITFNVSYERGKFGLDNIATTSTFGTRVAPASSPAPTAGEIALSPDQKYLYVSNRADKTQAGNTQDSIATFGVAEGAELTFMQLSASGGISPRHISITKDGNWVAIANSGNGNLSIFRRYPENGTISSLPIVSTSYDGASCALWYETCINR